ncbi:Rhodanese-like domain-containing protein [Fusarium globosum]|uniref:M-phase inducer phosphatase n=1 Tax=Fusarium globosum TaxID=78864 RepID=A0A8H5XLM9_9HYPO|nr:Rhodanese-like domain-containing protein [Fusarium globosum]
MTAPTNAVQLQMAESAPSCQKSGVPAKLIDGFGNAPCLSFDSSTDMIPRISTETLSSLLDNQLHSRRLETTIVDCRFRYEFEGGHVAGAINLHTEDLIDSWLLTAKQGTQQIVVLHCEHSVFRAPKMAQYIRSRDRAMNLKAYPHLTYPSLYILDGGYSKFFSQYPEKCSPQGYVKMDDESHHMSFNMEKYRIQQAKSSRGRRWTRFGQKHTLRPIPLQMKRTSCGK